MNEYSTRLEQNSYTTWNEITIDMSIKYDILFLGL